MKDVDAIVEWVVELLELEEARFLPYFNKIGKPRQKSLHDRHIKNKTFSQGDQALLYDSKYLKCPRKLHMHWLEPFIVGEVRELGVVRLVKIYGVLQLGWVNDSHWKPYIFSH
jgi:hypothetical protein